MVDFFVKMIKDYGFLIENVPIRWRKEVKNKL